MAPRALVTGASRGIGKAIALALADAGYDVAVAARTVAKGDPTGDHSTSIHIRANRPLPGSLEETASEIEARGREALRLRMDLTDLESVEAACTELLDTWGGVGVIVHNGRHIGPGLMDTILETPIDEYRGATRPRGKRRRHVGAGALYQTVRRVGTESRVTQIRSMMVAVPMPPPVHMVMSAVDRSRRSSSSSAVWMSMPPVAPMG